MALSAIAVMVNEGFTPGFADMAEPSHTYMLSYPNTLWSISMTPFVLFSPITAPPKIWAVDGDPFKISVLIIKALPSTSLAMRSAIVLAIGMKGVGFVSPETLDLKLNQPLVM